VSYQGELNDKYLKEHERGSSIKRQGMMKDQLKGTI